MLKLRARSRLLKKNFPTRLDEVAHETWLGVESIEIWFQDEARIGQKNKITRRWAKRGTRPSAPRDQRTASTYIFGAVCPKEGKGAGLILPDCNTAAMNLHLAEIAAAIAPSAHAVLIVDQAGWHMSKRLVVPRNITLIPLPPKCPSGSSCVTTGSRTASSNPTTISSIIAVRPGTSSQINHGASCPSHCANGPMGSDQRDLVLLGRRGIAE